MNDDVFNHASSKYGTSLHIQLLLEPVVEAQVGPAAALVVAHEQDVAGVLLVLGEGDAADVLDFLEGVAKEVFFVLKMIMLSWERVN